MNETAYIDHNATTPPLPEVIAAVCEAMSLIGANPSSIHANGRAARKLIDDARANVAALVGATPEEVDRSLIIGRFWVPVGGAYWFHRPSMRRF